MQPDEETRALNERIGEEICHLRLGRNMTQSALGELIGVTQHQIHRYESGQGTLSVQKLALIAKALNVDAGHFFGQGRAMRNLAPANLGFGDDAIGLCSKTDVDLAVKIARIRSDEARQDILTSIEQTVELLLHAQRGGPAAS